MGRIRKCFCLPSFGKKEKHSLQNSFGFSGLFFLWNFWRDFTCSVGTQGVVRGTPLTFFRLGGFADARAPPCAPQGCRGKRMLCPGKAYSACSVGTQGVVRGTPLTFLRLPGFADARAPTCAPKGCRGKRMLCPGKAYSAVFSGRSRLRKQGKNGVLAEIRQGFSRKRKHNKNRRALPLARPLAGSPRKKEWRGRSMKKIQTLLLLISSVLLFRAWLYVTGTFWHKCGGSVAIS